jgi:phospholipid-binding lipoprotein MlaA
VSARWSSHAAAAAACALLAGALAAPVRAQQAADAEEPRAEHEARSVHDPLEPVNRAIFSFNETLDRWVLEPVATGWDFVTPDPFQRGISNFFGNLAMPRRILNELLQGKPRKAGTDLGRFAINTTFGLLGFFDPAGEHGFPPANADFGQTLGVWGTPPGPYLVLPFFGPSNPRDTVGLVVDTASTVEFWIAPYYVSYPAAGTRIINARSLALETVRAERAAAFDFYAAVRSAFMQYRANHVRGRVDEPEDEDADEDLYMLEDDEDEEE